MSSDHKTYEPELDDTESLEFTLRFLVGPLKLRRNEDQYAVDYYFIDKNGNRVNLEVDRKYSWVGMVFPYKTIHIPHRKERIKEGLHIMFNKELSSALLLDYQDIHESPVIEKNTIYTKGEKFFEIEPSKAIFGFDEIRKTLSGKMKLSDLM